MYSLHCISAICSIPWEILHGSLYPTVEEAHKMALRAMEDDINIESAYIVNFETGEIMEEL